MGELDACDGALVDLGTCLASSLHEGFGQLLRVHLGCGGLIAHHLQDRMRFERHQSMCYGTS